MNGKKLKQFKNKWRIIILRHIATLLKNIADTFEAKEKEMIIAYATKKEDAPSYPVDILKPDNKPGFIHIPGLFVHIEEINNLTECDEKKMHKITEEIRSLESYLFGK